MTEPTPPTGPVEPSRAWEEPELERQALEAETVDEQAAARDEFDAWLTAQEAPVEDGPEDAPAEAPTEDAHVVEASAEEPPAELPPAEEPPAEEPPAEEPPAEEPPAEVSPVEPAVAEPVIEQPAAEDTWAAAPSVDMPSIEQPPVVEAPVVEAPVAWDEPSDRGWGDDAEPHAPQEPAPAEEPFAAEALPEPAEPEPAPVVETVAEPVAETAVPETVAATVEETVEAADEEDEEDEEPVPDSGRRTLGVLAALAVLLAGGVGVLAERVVATRGGGSVETARSDGLAAARGAARIVFSYDYRHLAKDFAAGKAVTTGGFAQEYARTTSKLITDVAPRYKAVVVADVSDAAVVTAGSDRVVALVFVNQQSTSTLAAQPRITQSRLEMTLVKRGGHWLVEKIRAF